MTADSLITRAEETAATLLDCDPFRAARWLHVQAVARQATNIATKLGDIDGPVLVAAAWLHDVGYSPSVVVTGFHPLDGAAFLLEAGFPLRVCALVANHSGAAREAQLRGLSAAMEQWPDERSPVSDGLWCCDMTTSPTGVPVKFDERLGEIARRYGPEHTVSEAIAAEAPRIEAAIRFVRGL